MLGLDLPWFELFVLLGVGIICIFLERVRAVLLSVVSPVLVTSILRLILFVSLVAGVVFLVALLISKVHLLGLLERLLDVLVLDPLSSGRSFRASLDHRLRINPSSWLVPLQNAVIRGLLSGDTASFPVLMHGVVNRSSFVGGSGSGSGVILQASVGVVFIPEPLHFFRALRVNIVFEAAFVGLVHS